MGGGEGEGGGGGGGEGKERKGGEEVEGGRRGRWGGDYLFLLVLWGLLPCSSMRQLYPNYQPYTYVKSQAVSVYSSQ